MTNLMKKTSKFSFERRKEENLFIYLGFLVDFEQTKTKTRQTNILCVCVFSLCFFSAISASILFQIDFRITDVVVGVFLLIKLI